MSTEPRSGGLDGVVAAQTLLSHVDGENGELIIGGYRVDDLAPNARFEEAVALLWNGERPAEAEYLALRARIAAQRRLPDATWSLLHDAAARRVGAMDALRMAVGSLDSGAGDRAELAVRILAACPVIVAGYWRLLHGDEPVEAPSDVGHAAAYLHMLFGEAPSRARVRGLETYLNTVIDHGMNASTFAARVIIATHSDLVSAVTGAVGALKGPLHGGAPGPALDMVFEIGEPERAEPYLRQKIESGERLMGFGHRVYKVRDPRADVLKAAAEKLAAEGEARELQQLAGAVEETAIRLLEEYKPGRRLQTNVEYYTALLLHSVGLDSDLFTPTFAIGRAAGWIAHCFEQLDYGRLIRPQSEYVGPRDGVWEPAATVA